MLLDKKQNNYCTELSASDLFYLLEDVIWSTNKTGDLTLYKWSSQQSPGVNVINNLNLIYKFCQFSPYECLV